MTSILYITKWIYIIQPEIEVFQLTFCKAVLSILILVLYLNKSIKYVNWDSLDPDSYGALIFKSCQSVICIIISYTAMKHFNVSTTSVVCSLSPFFAVFLAWLFLGEHITPYTIISVVIVILCVTMIIFGSQGEQKTEMD